MKIVQRTGPGEVGLNYMWLPTFIGMNGQLIKEIETHISPLFVGKPLTEEVLDSAGEAVVAYLAAKFPNLKGISEYLDGLKYVETDGKIQEAAPAEGRQAAYPAG